MRNGLRDLKVKMDPGCCCIKMNPGLHVFLVEDRTHPHYTVIYNTLEHLTANEISFSLMELCFSFNIRGLLFSCIINSMNESSLLRLLT